MAKYLKVLLVAHIGLPWGGVSQRYSDLLASSLAQKIDLTFFESSPNKILISSTGMLTFQNIKGSFDVLIKYIMVVFRYKPSIVHIATAHGYSFIKNSVLIIIAKLLGSKVILAPHCSTSVFIPKSRFSIYWMQYILNKCDGLVVLSSEWLAIQKISSIPKVILLKNSINLKNYLKLERPSKKDNEEIRIIYLGHIGLEKGIADLIQAVKVIDSMGIKGYKIFVYGEELHRGELCYAKELVRSLNVEDLFLFFEPVFGDKKLEVFRNADIFILPSHHEGLPISIIEAMAANLPVIATNVGGIPDLVDNSKNGILVNSNDPHDLANAMVTLIENEQLRHSFGLEGRRKALENHDIENYVDRLIGFYQRVLG